MYIKSDQEEILRLAKVAVATQTDMDSIYYLFKKYVRPNAVMYQINCNCSTSISKYYQLLLEWHSENADKFNIIEDDIRNTNNKK
jgi:hypothetical protein